MSTQEAVYETLASGDRLSLEEYLRRYEAAPDVINAELIEGVVWLPSQNRYEHCLHHGLIIGWLFTYAAQTPGVLAGSSPTAIMLGSAPQPDGVMRIEPERGGQARVEGNYLHGAPELIVEVSMSTAAYDLFEKKDIYARAGVREYVVLILRERNFHWYVLSDGSYTEEIPWPGGIYRSLVFPGLWLDANEALAANRPRVMEALDEGLNSDAHARFVNDLAAGKQ